MPTLTDKTIQALDPPITGRRLVFGDHREAPRGFGIRINSGGKRAFVLRYKAGGAGTFNVSGRRAGLPTQPPQSPSCRFPARGSSSDGFATRWLGGPHYLWKG